MNEEEKKAIERIKRDYKLAKSEDAIDIDIFTEDIKTVLNLLENKDKQIEQYQNMLATNDMLHVLECEKKDKIINNAIVEIENLRQYFSEDLQPDFIRILEILKDKKVIDC